MVVVGGDNVVNVSICCSPRGTIYYVTAALLCMCVCLGGGSSSVSRADFDFSDVLCIRMKTPEMFCTPPSSSG